jgi:alpha,alpha-trehalase
MSETQTPAKRFGPLFAAVQESGLFHDSKTFADAIPIRPAAQIVEDWTRDPAPDLPALRSFVESNFIIPEESDSAAPQGLALNAHIGELWGVLTRTPEPASPGGSEIALPFPYVVPGGRFRELYYWDSYFTMLGLTESGRQDLVEHMIADFGSLIDRFGHIPNGTRTYYLSRSQPPLFYLMAGLSRDDSVDARRQRLTWMEREYSFWMSGAETLAPGDEHRRVVCVADGARLNRYWDDIAAPRDESWREDVALAAAAHQPKESLWRNLRAAAESGWDFSSRWLADRNDLATIRTTRLLPIDLNCLLHGLEEAVAREAAGLGLKDTAERFLALATKRAEALERLFWNEEQGFYADFDLDRGTCSDELTAAAAFALFAGVAASDRAKRLATSLRRLVLQGGIVTTTRASGQQWDAPNGWAPLQWIAVVGLCRYDERDLATEIRSGWLGTVESHFQAHGQLLEKYDVAHGGAGGGGEYGTETGFGWTNGVTLSLSGALPA